MSISANNDRLTVIIPKSLKSDLKEIADKENRSISNYVVYILDNHVKEYKINKASRDSNARNQTSIIDQVNRDNDMENKHSEYMDIELNDK